jgi:hypothetical protein
LQLRFVTALQMDGVRQLLRGVVQLDATQLLLSGPGLIGSAKEAGDWLSSCGLFVVFVQRPGIG